MSKEMIHVESDKVGGLEHSTALVPVETLGEVITELLRPVMQTIGKMLENNTAALEQLSAAQSVQNDRLEALEKQIRLQTPVSATVKLGNAIRKAVLSRYGVSGLREVPKHEYNVALQQIGMWSDALTVRDVVKEARKRAELAEQSSGVDGEETPARPLD